MPSGPCGRGHTMPVSPTRRSCRGAHSPSPACYPSLACRRGARHVSKGKPLLTHARAARTGSRTLRPAGGRLWRRAAGHSRRTQGRLPPTRRGAPRCRFAVPAGRDQTRRAASGRGRVNPQAADFPIALQYSPHGCGHRAPTDRWAYLPLRHGRRWSSNGAGSSKSSSKE